MLGSSRPLFPNLILFCSNVRNLTNIVVTASETLVSVFYSQTCPFTCVSPAVVLMLKTSSNVSEIELCSDRFDSGFC